MVEIVKSVHQVDGVNANSYLVEEPDGSLTLIDCGTSAKGKKILEYTTAKLGKKPNDIRTIVLTHWHVDHVRGAAALKAATGGRVAVHEGDADIVAGKAKSPPIPGATGVLFGFLSLFFKSTPVEPDWRLKDGDAVGSLTVIHTPGHTTGSISLLHPEGKVLFVGDAITLSDGRPHSPPKQFTTDMPLAMRSVKKISGLEFEVMLSGHGIPLKSDKAPEKVLEFLAESQGKQ